MFKKIYYVTLGILLRLIYVFSGMLFCITYNNTKDILFSLALPGLAILMTILFELRNYEDIIEEKEEL